MRKLKTERRELNKNWEIVEKGVKGAIEGIEKKLGKEKNKERLVG